MFVLITNLRYEQTFLGLSIKGFTFTAYCFVYVFITILLVTERLFTKCLIIFIPLFRDCFFRISNFSTNTRNTLNPSVHRRIDLPRFGPSVNIKSIVIVTMT